MVLLMREDIAEFSREILKVLDKVNSEDDLAEITEKQFSAKRGVIDFNLRPSDDETLAHKISYVVDGLGIPLEVVVNPSLDYSKIILKNRNRVLGYSEFLRDTFGNVIQSRIIDTSNISAVKKELEKLCAY